MYVNVVFVMSVQHSEFNSGKRIALYKNYFLYSPLFFFPLNNLLLLLLLCILLWAIYLHAMRHAFFTDLGIDDHFDVFLRHVGDLRGQAVTRVHQNGVIGHIPPVLKQ